MKLLKLQDFAIDIDFKCELTDEYVFEASINGEIIDDDLRYGIEKQTISAIKNQLKRQFILEVKAALGIINADLEVENEYLNSIINVLKK